AGQFRTRRKNDRQILVGNWDQTVLRAINDRYGRAPVALARDTPVAKPEHGFTAAETSFLSVRGHPGDGFLDRKAVIWSGVDEFAVLMFLKGLGHRGRLQGLTLKRLDDNPNR